MIIFSLIGVILCLVGVILTLPKFNKLMNVFGWGSLSVGMLFVLISAIIKSNLLTGILSVIFLFGNIYYLIDSYKIYKKSSK